MFKSSKPRDGCKPQLHLHAKEVGAKSSKPRDGCKPQPFGRRVAYWL